MSIFDRPAVYAAFSHADHDEGPTDIEIREALADYAKTAAKMPCRSGMGWLNDQHSRIHERINLLLDQLGL